MKEIYDFFPFAIYAEHKTSGAGNNYLSIGVKHAKKLKEPDENGNKYESVWFNLIDKRDLLALSAACQHAYESIVIAENAERSTGGTTAKPSPQRAAQFDDEIPY